MALPAAEATSATYWHLSEDDAGLANSRLGEPEAKRAEVHATCLLELAWAFVRCWGQGVAYVKGPICLL